MMSNDSQIPDELVPYAGKLSPRFYQVRELAISSYVQDLTISELSVIDSRPRVHVHSHRPAGGTHVPAACRGSFTG